MDERSRQRRKKFWLVLGIILNVIPFINRYDTWDEALWVCGISALLFAAAWHIAPEYMRYMERKLLGIWMVVIGVGTFVSGTFFLFSFILVIAGVMCVLGEF